MTHPFVEATKIGAELLGIAELESGQKLRTFFAPQSGRRHAIPFAGPWEWVDTTASGLREIFVGGWYRPWWDGHHMRIAEVSVRHDGTTTTREMPPPPLIIVDDLDTGPMSEANREMVADWYRELEDSGRIRSTTTVSADGRSSFTYIGPGPSP